MSAEVMQTSSTGGNKSSKLARYDLIPPTPLRLLAEHFGRATKEHGGKYDDRNWEKGYDWSLCFAALQRHAWAFWGGEDIDPDTGSPHLAAVAWHAFALLEYGKTHPQYDDRTPPDPHAKLREIEKRFEEVARNPLPKPPPSSYFIVPPERLANAAPDVTGEDITVEAARKIAELHEQQKQQVAERLDLP